MQNDNIYKKGCHYERTKKICRKRIKMDMEDIQVLKEYYVYGGIHKEGKGL